MHRRNKASAYLFLAMAALVGCASAAWAVTAADGSSHALGEPETLVLLPDGQEQGSQPAVRVIHSGDESLQLEFELPAMAVQPLEFEGQTYHVLEIGGGGFDGAAGEPMLPTFSRLIQIPDRAGVSFEVVSVETTELAGYQVFPMQPEDAADFVINREAYAGAGYSAEDRVRIGDPAIARDLRVVAITFRPVRYDPSRETIEVASRIRVDITFGGVDLRNARERHHRAIPASFDRLYRNLVVNYEGPREGQSLSLGSCVIICPNNSSVVDALQPLVEWRTRKGYDVYLATTAETGSSRNEIKDWLENAYNTWENPPELISLVGDANGSVVIPAWSHSGGDTDHPYCQLDGTDVLADAHIGRISVDSVDQLRLYVTKIVGYESTPYMANTDWYTRACLVGDPGLSGITCVQIMQWLKVRLLQCGYTEVDTIFSSPWVSQMRNALNRGDTVFNYRGWLGMSGFGVGDIMALQNGWKMPYAVNLTCGTGDFASGTSRSEAWIRAGIPPDTPTGGIASIGTATCATHTRHNNCMMYGVWRGVFWEELYTFGESFTRGKYELYINYGVADPGACNSFTQWNNLIGDAAGEIWTAVPRSIVVTYPSSIPLGTNSVTVDVTALGYPCQGAYVCLWKDDETHVGGYTDSGGTVELPVNTPAEGDMLITVTKHDHHPYLSSIAVDQADRFVGYFAHIIDDDDSGSSSGNGDGQPNPGERIEIPVQVMNFGTQTAQAVTGTLTEDDPYVTIHDAEETFGDISPGAAAWSGDDFDIEIGGGAPNGHVIRLGLDLQSGADIWHALIDISVVSAEFVYDDITLYGFGSQIDPGESGEISVRMRNVGDAAATSVTGTLVSGSAWVTVTDTYGTFGNIGTGATGENTANHFGISASTECFQGHVAPMNICLQFSDGARDTMHFALSVGTASSNDPTGPDAYGYYAFDNTDSGYPDAPTYNWIEIAPNHGGPGTDVGLSDYGGNNDDSKVVDLPFPFVFYGETFTRATICSNGWVAMGSTYLENRRNWNIPAAGAPSYLIAPMWDNLYQSGSDKVYHWFDADNHRYIIQWSDLRNNQGGSLENFEVIFYDPEHHPTATGDGEIVFQYETFNNSDYLQHYCTVGIENEDQTDGVLYTYYNLYNAGATTIQSGRAIKFTVLSGQPRGTLTGMVTNETNGGTPLEGATIRILETGKILTSGSDGIYVGAVEVGIYTVSASHASFEPDTAYYVWISEGHTTHLDFALTDIMPPVFSGTTDYSNTSNTAGPYEIYSTVIEYSDFEHLSLAYNVAGTGWVPVPMTDLGDNLYMAAIPGQEHMSLIKYYLSGEDVGGNAASDPANAPWESYWFWVLEPLFEDDMELGPGDWAHYVVTTGFVDQWHRSSQRNHTPGGSWSWKFGDEGGDNYADLSDGALETAPIAINGEAVLNFWHWMDAEVSGAYPDYAYDGGIVEVSIDGGEWTQIAPAGGYPYLIREGSIPGPFPAETRVFSGTHDWTEVQFDLSELSGSARFRFRFGSDGAETREGWFIDDVEIIPSGPDPSGARDLELLPSTVALYQNRPNPFGEPGAGTRIRFDLPQTTQVRLRVFDASGRLVRTLVDGGMPAGRHRLSWDGRDAGAHPVASGVYFCILEAAGQNQSKQMLILR